ncbi:radical SAM protein [Azohydromonas lata]|uniref:Radical SAM protein n=1 Tax=Azohydromonas lata TaxID=45677 RepID=A0ABU5ICP2_9BURK|nr:radical SAM protein [Azohydromonas lata]MDZ5456898.1 radical SAM protein [Azohydromonas lata]
MTDHPSIVYIRLLQKCNARCVMCTSYQQSRDEAHLDYVKSLIDEFEGLGVNEVRFTGGETLMYRQLRPLLAFIADKRMAFSFITNGAYLKKFSQELVDAHVGKIICSIDSPRPEIHNRVRQTQRLLETASAGIKTINQKSAQGPHAVQFMVNTVVSSENYDHLRDFLPFLHEHGIKYWNLIPIHGELPIRMGPPQIDAAIREIEHILGRIERENLGLSLNISDPMDFFATAVRGAKPAELTGGLQRCHVVSHVAFIDAVNGKLTGCNDLMYSGFDEMIVGDILGKPFRQVWDAPAFRQTRDGFSCQALHRCDRCEPTNIKLNKHLENVGADSNAGTLPAWF